MVGKKAMSGSDVQSRIFMTSMRGYDRAEVDRFLDELAGELDQLHEQLVQRDADEGATLLLLKTAAKTADELVADATVEAERLGLEAFKETAWLRSQTTVEVAHLRSRTARWAERLEEEMASKTARANERAMAEAAKVTEEAELRAIEITRLARAEAEAALQLARREANEAFEQIEQARKVMAAQAQRLRVGSAVMVDVAAELEARSTHAGGNVIEMASIIANGGS